LGLKCGGLTHTHTLSPLLTGSSPSHLSVCIRDLGLKCGGLTHTHSHICLCVIRDWGKEHDGRECWVLGCCSQLVCNAQISFLKCIWVFACYALVTHSLTDKSRLPSSRVISDVCVSFKYVSKLSGAARIGVNMRGGFVCCVRVLLAVLCLYGYISFRAMCACTPLAHSAGHGGRGTLTLSWVYLSMIGNSTSRAADFIFDAALAGAINARILGCFVFTICFLGPPTERPLPDILNIVVKTLNRTVSPY